MDELFDVKYLIRFYLVRKYSI